MSILLGKKIKLFSLSSNRDLAEEIASSIGLELSHCEVKHFADGEINVDISETVRGHHIFVIQPVSSPVNDNLMELLIMCDALKRASAKTINLVVPYYGYSRQDRKVKSRQPITAKLVADLIQTAGADRVICMDIHATQIQGFFNIPVDNFLGLPILCDYLFNLGLLQIFNIGAYGCRLCCESLFFQCVQKIVQGKRRGIVIQQKRLHPFKHSNV